MSQGHIFEEEMYSITKIEISMLQTFDRFRILDRDQPYAQKRTLINLDWCFFLEFPFIWICASFSHVLLLGSLSCYNRKKMESCFNDWEVSLATTTKKWGCVLIIGQCVLLQ